MSIWAHSLIRNEERYVWFSVMSVIDYVDKIMIWDTGSADNTIKIIKEIKKRYPKKVDFRQVVQKDIFKFTKLRQQMLEQTRADWFMILDGDEVWWDSSIEAHINFINKRGKDLETLVTPYYNLIGDIYHYQEKKAGQYQIDGKQGHLNIRFISTNIPGLHYDKPHGQLAIVDSKGNLIQERKKEKRLHLNKHYLHFTNMLRSSTRQEDLSVPKRGFKYKYELGLSFPRDFYYPEVFFRSRPDVVPDPWQRRGSGYVAKSLMVTLPKRLKRKIRMFSKSGY